MRFHRLDIPGAFLLEPEGERDRRGFFTRGYCQQLLEERGFDPAIVRCSVSVCSRRGTLRGLHWQAEPYAEHRLARAVKGRVHAVLADLRPDSPAYKRHQAVELDDQSRCSVYVPAGVAYGFQALTEDAEVMQQMSEVEHADSARGVRWNDPALDIDWPLRVTRISVRDRAFPDFEG